jgi:hypothetical protein
MRTGANRCDGATSSSCENLATQAMTNLAERGSLGVREHQLAFQLVFQDPVFGG